MPSYLITGASRGIGLGFAAELVSTSLLDWLVVHGATTDALQTIAQEQRQHRCCHRQKHRWLSGPEAAQGPGQGRPSLPRRPGRRQRRVSPRSG